MKINKKKIFLFLVIILIVMFLLFLLKNVTKKQKTGNNINSQEIVDRILNLSSYKSRIYVQVKSNKNENKYILKQEYSLDNGFVQEVLEPANIAGIKIIKKGETMTLQNSEFNLTTIFENYNGLEDNCLDLINFINDYKKSDKSMFEEVEGKIVMKTRNENSNRYTRNKILYINKETHNPTKLIIQDNNQNTTIIIEYNEIELN